MVWKKKSTCFVSSRKDVLDIIIGSWHGMVGSSKLALLAEILEFCPCGVSAWERVVSWRSWLGRRVVRWRAGWIDTGERESS